MLLAASQGLLDLELLVAWLLAAWTWSLYMPRSCCLELLAAWTWSFVDAKELLP